MTRLKPSIAARWIPLAICALVVACAPLGESEVTYTDDGYTLSRDYALERQVLRIQRSAELEAECMQAPLPVGTAPGWKQARLDQAIHTELTELISDAERVPSYEADTEASIAAERFVCEPSAGGEFCYAPAVSVSGVESSWRFALDPAEVELSPLSEALIERFLAAHRACWQTGAPM